ncbi:M17 family metallopeptidase [Mycoplasmopsis hyopharyngis]|uniref:M17 family metallopeptidase n=1 Tax=Mycoplasmopsis hyopharyngis TaxID=29558 RepID=UPI0038736FC6
MFIKNITTSKTKEVVLKGIYKQEKLPANLIEKANKITEFLDKNEAYVFLDKEEKFGYDEFYALVKKLVVEAPRNYLVDLKTFVNKKLTLTEVIDAFVKAYNFVNADIYDAKTEEKEQRFELVPYVEKLTDELTSAFEKAKIISEAQNFARNLQVTPPNICNSEYLAEQIVKDFSKVKGLKVTVLDKAAIEKEKMGLLLSVNRGSVYEPRVVIVEYNGNPSSKEKTVYVGKGITFDSGGYSLKPSRSMLGMKFDMSGSVIVASAVKAIAQLKGKQNVAAIMCITDNRVNGDASLPDSVWKSMSGKTVEINNTDAEGRLVLADGLYYGATKLHATRLVDVATLTGAIVSALGQTYTGIWATSDKAWKDILAASEAQHELLWRMPFDDAFMKNIKDSKVADMKNTDLSGQAGSCSAAMFLKEFTNDVEYVHCDIAGTADIDEVPQGVLVKTLTEMGL